MVDLGGGANPRPGFVNVDRLPYPGVDVLLDLDMPGARLPFADDAVCEVYSSHMIEHVADGTAVLREVLRICCPGAKVEFRVPHWNSQTSATAGHRFCVSEEQMALWVGQANGAKRLELLSIEYSPSDRFEEAKRLKPRWSDEQIFRYMPGTCHETRFFFMVVLNGNQG